MNDKQRKDYEEFLETDFSFDVPGVARFRVNAFNQNRGAGAVFRTIPSKVLTMEDLGMGKVFLKISDFPRGIVLVTHYQRLLDYIVPDFVHVLSNGQIIKSGGKELAHELEEHGYGWLTGDRNDGKDQSA